MKKAERAAYIRKKAREMAATGEYSGWLIIEQMFRFQHGLYEARTVLDEQYIRSELDDICKTGAGKEGHARLLRPTGICGTPHISEN